MDEDLKQHLEAIRLWIKLIGDVPTPEPGLSSFSTPLVRPPCETSAAPVYAAMSRLMVRRLTKT
jgi:hypothetical protein